MWDGFAHVDPVKEAKAQSIRLASETTTLAEECSAEGRDYAKVMRQRAQEQRMRKKLGLPKPNYQKKSDDRGDGEDKYEKNQ